MCSTFAIWKHKLFNTGLPEIHTFSFHVFLAIALLVLAPKSLHYVSFYYFLKFIPQLHYLHFPNTLKILRNHYYFLFSEFKIYFFTSFRYNFIVYLIPYSLDPMTSMWSEVAIYSSMYILCTHSLANAWVRHGPWM